LKYDATRAFVLARSLLKPAPLLPQKVEEGS
jgi:hypothetical protein